jgi:aromatic-L-amino-acid decarboxylase
VTDALEAHRGRCRPATAVLIVGVAGSTDTGSIDPLERLADIAARAGAWFHVDAAYGGFFALTERGRERLSGIDRPTP